jgi:hypothetical protein
MDLEKLKELCEKASAGPWEYSEEDGLIESGIGGICWIQEHGSIHTVRRTGEHRKHADGHFVVAARSAVPELIERVLKLEEALRWYADESNYTIDYADELLRFRVVCDDGSRAREAINAEGEKDE